MSTKLHGFDYATYLKRHLMAGIVDPWRKDEEDKPYFGLLVPFETAWEECKGWSGEDIGKVELTNYLKLNNIWIIRSPEEFVRQKEKLEEERRQIKEERRSKNKRVISQETRNMLKERMEKLNKEKNPRSLKIDQ
jgi:hypothetical protein